MGKVLSLSVLAALALMCGLGRGEPHEKKDRKSVV